MANEFRKQYREVVPADHLPSEIRIGDIDFPADEFPVRYGLTPATTAAKAYPQKGYTGPSALTAEVIQEGEKIRSYGNIEDWDTGISLIVDLSRAFPNEEYATFMKHGIPFQVAKADDMGKAYRLAFERDTLIKLGATVALSGRVDRKLAEFIKEYFIDGIVAQDYTDDAIDILRTKKDLRILKESMIREDMPDHGYEFKNVKGGVILSDRHKVRTVTPEDIIVTSKRQPEDPRTLTTALLQWIVNTYVRSNAATFGDENIVYGVGSGQGSRVDAIKTALSISAERCPYYRAWLEKKDYPLVLATDGFPPEKDSVETCDEYHIEVFMSPKGSLKDQIVQNRADELGLITLIPKSNERPFTHR
jgi:phosphoribosylaminoimidazolecarboxamide formyltransferase/IMP cyclohydrolase